MRSFAKILFVLVLVALVGFTLVVNEDKITEPILFMAGEYDERGVLG